MQILGFNVKKRGRYYSAYKMIQGKQREVYIGKTVEGAEGKILAFCKKYDIVDVSSVHLSLIARIRALEEKVNNENLAKD